MMNRTTAAVRPLLYLLFMLCGCASASAHTPLLIVEDNGNGTLRVEGGFSTGQVASGVNLYIRNRLEGKTLQHLTFPDSGELEITIPAEPYYLVMDAGPGHKVVKPGIVPPGGYTVNSDAVSVDIEGDDLSGLPLPIPAIIGILVIAGILAFLLPRIIRKPGS